MSAVKNMLCIVNYNILWNTFKILYPKCNNNVNNNCKNLQNLKTLKIKNYNTQEYLKNIVCTTCAVQVNSKKCMN